MMTKPKQPIRRICSSGTAVLILTLGLSGNVLASGFSIDGASWSNYRDRLTVYGECNDHDDVTVTNAATGAYIGTDECDDGRWRVRKSNSNNSDVA